MRSSLKDCSIRGPTRVKRHGAKGNGGRLWSNGLPVVNGHKLLFHQWSNGLSGTELGNGNDGGGFPSGGGESPTAWTD